MQTEIKKQLEELEFLKKQSLLNEEFIQKFRVEIEGKSNIEV